MKKFTGLTDRHGKKIYDGTILKIDLGMRMHSENPESKWFYVKVYYLDYCWMVTANSGWQPSGYSDWTLSGTLGNYANKDVKVFDTK